MGRDNREGGLGDLEERPGESSGKGVEAGGQDPFFVDFKGISAEELVTLASTEYIVYDRCNVDILGTTPEADSLQRIDRQGNRCFNCGSLQHIVTNCTEPLNRPLIALSRAMFEFFRDPGKGQPERLHEHEERKAQRLRFNECFAAGSIHGELLRDALGITEFTTNEGEARELPWLWSMLDWGYPPGWVSEEDPKLKIRARMEGESIWTDDLDAAVLIDNPPQPSSSGRPDVSTTNVTDDTDISTAPTVTEQRTVPRRWAHYPTSLFSSEHLAVYTGVPLPPLVHNGPVAVQQEQQNSVPPWRRPGAFSAFGPAGWQEYAKETHFTAHTRILDFPVRGDSNDGDEDAAQSDMDLSE